MMADAVAAQNAGFPILEYQPLKALYLIYFATSFLVKLPIWASWYIIPSRRLRPSWTLKRSMIVRIAQELEGMKVELKSENAPPKEVADSSLKDAKFTWIERIPEDLFAGEVRRYANITGVQPVRTAGFWLLKENTPWDSVKAKPGEKTVLHFHGGAYYIGSANPSDITATLTRGLLRHSKTLMRTLAVEYRLCDSAPYPAVNPFPAALLDAIAAYRYLVHDAGFEPQNIVILGDSAGGNLALAFVRYLLETPAVSAKLPIPGKVVVASPWIDLSMSRRGPGTSETINGPVDIFGVSDEDPFAAYGVRSLLGPLPFEEARTNRYLSPVSLYVKPRPDAGEEGLFKGHPDTYIVAGGAERLLDDAEALVEGMRKDGVNVVRDIPPDAVHDFVVFSWHEPEHTHTLRRIARWIDSASM
ncbi:alpha/beta-hydrolase [Lenzites betulinus]|nr:alpha/beta-hydrolase [Lenzites betulinus]